MAKACQKCRNGHVNKEAMADEKVTHSELVEAFRREGHTSMANIDTPSWKTTAQ